MIDVLISSKTRIKLLMKFFLNSNTTAYLRSLEAEFGDSSNGIRVELNRMEDAGLINSTSEGNRKIYRANQQHPLFKEIHSILLKTIGLDQVIESVIQRLGDVKKVYLVGEFSKGLDSPILDLLIIGDVDTLYLAELVQRTEGLIKRKIRYLLYSNTEAADNPWEQYNPTPLLIFSQP
jgi:hypothetical protein